MDKNGSNRILIVDDDPGVRRLLTRCLGDAGWEVVAVSGIPEAFHEFQPGRFNALLSDVDLPGSKDGIGLARELMSMDPALRAAMMSGTPVNEEKAKRAGLGLFLHKPFELGAVVGLMKSFRTDRGAAAAKPDHILLVEDDADVREIIALCINTAGWEAVAARNGAEALRIFERGKFHMLIADVRLNGGIDGIEVAKRFLGFEPKLKVVIISGIPGISNRVKEAGLGLFFPKPAGIEALADFLELSRAHFENGVSKRLLIVEDDAVELEEHCLMLRGIGYEVTGAHSAEEALACAQNGRFDAILTDNLLPGMTGLRAISELKKRSTAPILLMVNQPSPEVEKDALLLGAAAVIEKPLDYPLLDRKLADPLP
ncbi:MAG: response regulator [Elusimicrobiota bacterium]